MKLQVVEVTPSQAKDWLKMNTLNRPVRKSYVEHLAGCMKRGEWTVNHQAVAINGSKLIDGQHRLMAVIASGLPAVKMTVIKDVETSTFDTIDIGAKRTHSDIFREDVHVMLPITFIGKMIFGQRCTPRTIKPIYEKLHRQMREVVDAIPRQTKKLNAGPIRVAALAAILKGENKRYVLDLYKAMADFDTQNMPPVAGNFMKQITIGVSTVGAKTAGGSKAQDLLVRAFTTFQHENAEMLRLLVKKPATRVAEIRDIYKAALGIGGGSSN